MWPSGSACFSDTDSYQVVLPFTRRCSSSSVRWQRSMNPLDCGRPTCAAWCSVSSSSRNSSLGVLVRAAAALPTVVAQHCLDLHPVLPEEGRHIVVEDLDCRHRHLRRVEPGPHVAARAVQHCQVVDLAHPLQRARGAGGTHFGNEVVTLSSGAAPEPALPPSGGFPYLTPIQPPAEPPDSTGSAPATG